MSDCSKELLMCLTVQGVVDVLECSKELWMCPTVLRSCGCVLFDCCKELWMCLTVLRSCGCVRLF